jgi:hypothetical protein
MSEAVYADAGDYQYLRTRLREAEVLLKTVLRDGEMNVHSATGQLIHAWLIDRNSVPTPPEQPK